MPAISLQIPSPVTPLHSPLLETRQLTLHVKRDDLIHPLLSGNKWRKLKYNLQQAQLEQKKGLLTFGGAWSNHIHATAATGYYSGFETIGIIRGHAAAPLTATLQDAQQWGMQLQFMDRETYRKKYDSVFLTTLQQQHEDFFLIPEGGNNSYGRRGIGEIWTELEEDYDVVCVDCGTGTSLAGLINGNTTNTRILGFAVMKGGDYLHEEVQSMLYEERCSNTHWQINSDYHFGGFAKTSPGLLAFMQDFSRQQGIALEPVYSAKLFYGLFDLIQQDYFSPGTRILAIHGGGLQGLRGYGLAFEAGETPGF